MRRLLLAALLACAACPPPPGPDGGVADSGAEPDAGEPDSGEEPEDAGLPDAGFGSVPIDAWCATRALAECARDVRCLRLPADKLNECIKRKQMQPPPGCDQAAYSSGVKNNRLQYFAKDGAKCLDAYGWGSCVGTPAACDAIFSGLVPPDGGCNLVDECQSNAFCYQYTQTCPKKCLPYAALDAGCNFGSVDCDPNEGYCGQSAPGHPSPYSCQKRKGTGEDCQYWYRECRDDLSCSNQKCVKRESGPNEPCNEFNGYPFCTVDTFCRLGNKLPDGGQPGTCQKRVGLGGVCTGYASCLPNLRCSTTFGTGTCVELAGEGAPCTSEQDCKDELYCSVKTSTCTGYPDGGDCSNKGTFYACAPEFTCDYDFTASTWTCNRLGRVGDECTYDYRCLSNECKAATLADGGAGKRCSARCSERLDGG